MILIFLPHLSSGENNWLIVATGIADCYYNVTDLAAGGSFRFRVACVNKAGQGPYSNLSKVLSMDASGIYRKPSIVLHTLINETIKELSKLKDLHLYLSLLLLLLLCSAHYRRLYFYVYNFVFDGIIYMTNYSTPLEVKQTSVLYLLH